MGFPHSINTHVHIVAGSFALCVGLASLFSQKGGKRHRQAGKCLLPAAIIACCTAIVGVVLDPSRPALTAISISASYQLVSGMRALSLRGKTPTVWDALIAIVGLFFAIWFLLHMQGGTSSFPPAMGYSAMGYVVFLSCYDLSRAAWYQRWGPRVWPIDHGLKMAGFYFAMVAAAAGNLLRDFQPWSQIVPTVLGVVVLFVFAGTYFGKRRLQGTRAGISIS